jgi:hypothetical protein
MLGCLMIFYLSQALRRIDEFMKSVLCFCPIAPMLMVGLRVLTYRRRKKAPVVYMPARKARDEEAKRNDSTCPENRFARRPHTAARTRCTTTRCATGDTTMDTSTHARNRAAVHTASDCGSLYAAAVRLSIQTCALDALCQSGASKHQVPHSAMRTGSG